MQRKRVFKEEEFQVEPGGGVQEEEVVRGEGRKERGEGGREGLGVGDLGVDGREGG